MKAQTLLVGFDSAWTAHNSGAIIAILHEAGRNPVELEPPQIVNFSQAQTYIASLRQRHQPKATYIFIDQPTIVPNESGQRPVENIVASPIGLRFGGVQPANPQRLGMFLRQLTHLDFSCRS